MKRTDAVLLGLAWGPPVGVVTYALLRIVEQTLYPEPNPAMLLWSDRSPFVWRAAIALYVAGAAAFGGFAAARRSEDRAAKALRGIVIAAIALIVIQAAFWP